MEVSKRLSLASLANVMVMAIATDAQHSHDHPADQQQPSIETPQQSTALSHDSGHPTFLHFGSSATLLFKEWTTASWTMLIVASVVVAIVSIIYEFLQIAVGRVQVAACRTQVTSSAPFTPSSTSSLTLQSTEIPTKKPFRPTRSLVLLLLLQTLLHVVRVAIGYGLMLVVMSFNASIYLAVLLGAAIGHLCAAWTDIRLQSTSLTAEYRASTPGGEPQPLKMTYQACH